MLKFGKRHEFTCLHEVDIDSPLQMRNFTNSLYEQAKDLWSFNGEKTVIKNVMHVLG